MTSRVAAILSIALVAIAAASQLPALGLAARIAFVVGSAGPVGGVLLLAIARLTGTRWPAVVPPPWLSLVGGLAMLGTSGTALPPHLALWSHPVFVAARAAVAMAALCWAGTRLRGGAGPTFAGLTLALYAALVTPVAADWLLPAAPGHPVSAVGMMLFLVQFGAACAWGMVRAEGRTRQDLSLLLVAASLGLCYLAFVDYLIVWFGNLPERVPFYIDRSGWLAVPALVVGLGCTVAAVVLGRTIVAAACAAAGLTLFACWWIGGGAIAALIAITALLAVAAVLRREGARG